MSEPKHEKGKSNYGQKNAKSVQLFQSNRNKIAEAAYLRAEQRGFFGVDPAEIWLEVEKEILGET